MFLNSIRWRLQIWHGFLLVLVLAGFGLTADRLQRGNQFRRIDQELQRRTGAVGGMLRRPFEGPGRPPLERGRPPIPPPGIEFGPGGVGNRENAAGEPPGGRDQPTDNEVRPEQGRPPLRPPPGERERLGNAGLRDLPLRLPPQDSNLFEASTSNSFYYAVWARHGRLLSKSESAPSDVPQPSAGREMNETRMRGTLREMFHRTPPGECILVGHDISRELSDMRRFTGVLLAAGGAVLAFGLAGGWWLASRAISPIKEISATASKISCGNLSERIPSAGTDNELGQLASVLNSTFARLQAAFEQQARFTSDAAHELRTPVSVMVTQTQATLARERGAAEYRETVEACQRAAQRMRRLIESLLELARLDAGHEPMKRERFDLARTVRDCIEQVRPLAAERQISIQADLSGTECTGDAERISLVINNLLTNAIHYNKERGEVRVSAEDNHEAAILTVSDNGQGIACEDVPHLFERFWRADRSRSRANGRAGLGLAIAKTIVDAHGGTIEVTSEFGMGSTFTLRLPK